MIITRCPACATRFRVTPAQLRARNGRVRCGQCNTAFDGLAELLEDAETPRRAQSSAIRAAPPAPPDDETARTAPVLTDEAHAERPDIPLERAPAGPVESVDILLEAEAPEDAPPAPAGSTSPPGEALTPSENAAPGLAMPGPDLEAPPAATRTANREPAEPDTAEAKGPTAAAPTAIAGSARAPRDSGLDELLAALAASSRPVQHPASPAEPPVERETGPEAEPVPPEPALEPEKPEPRPPESPKPAPAKPGKRSKKERRAEAQAAPPPAEPEPAPPASPDFMLPPLEPRRPRKAVTFLWALLALAGLAGLTAQGTYMFRGELAARHPKTRPYLERACQRIGCEIPLLREPGLLGIESSDLHPVPSRSGGLELVASLRNRAPYPLAYPHLELTLTDVRDQPLLRRVFAPAEYAPSGTDVRAGFAPGTALPVSLQLQAEEVGASGYRIYVFYP